MTVDAIRSLEESVYVRRFVETVALVLWLTVSLLVSFGLLPVFQVLSTFSVIALVLALRRKLRKLLVAAVALQLPTLIMESISGDLLKASLSMLILIYLTELIDLCLKVKGSLDLGYFTAKLRQVSVVVALSSIVTVAVVLAATSFRVSLDFGSAVLLLILLALLAVQLSR